MGTARALVALSAVSCPACKDNVSNPYRRLLLSAMGVVTPLSDSARWSFAPTLSRKHHGRAGNQVPHRLPHHLQRAPGRLTSVHARQEQENPNECRGRALYYAIDSTPLLM